MVSDSSTTNIFTVNGVSQIRYRVYSQSCQKSSLPDLLKLRPVSSDGRSVSLIAAYHSLLSHSTPCTWRVAGTTNNGSVPLELWVFWFDERHTGLIDEHPILNALEEVNMGSFTWETISDSSKSHTQPYSHVAPTDSKTTSPMLSERTHGRQTLSKVTVAEEYKLFIKAIRNLFHASFIQRNMVPLGDFYIALRCYYEELANLHGMNRPITNGNNLPTTVVGYAFNAYLTGTDLVFQIYTRRLRLIPLDTSHLKCNGIKVILSPSGEHAHLARPNTNASKDTISQIIDEWAAILHIPVEQLLRQPDQEYDYQPLPPPLIPIRTKSNLTILYPSALVFVPTPIKRSSTWLAGCNGVFGTNRGMAQDLGNIWAQHSWVVSLSEAATDREGDGCSVDYWSFADMATRALMSSTLITPQTPKQTDISQMITDQNNFASPSVAAKIGSASVFSPFAVASDRSSPGEVERSPAVSTPRMSSTNSTSSLAEFVIRNFTTDADKNGSLFNGGIHEELDSNHLGYPIPTISSAQDQSAYDSSHQTLAFKTEQAEYNESSDVMQIDQPAQSALQHTSVNGNPNIDIPLDDHFNFSMYNGHQEEDMDMGMGVDDDFDLDITEEDFDFFKSNTPKYTIPTDGLVKTAPLMDTSDVFMVDAVSDSTSADAAFVDQMLKPELPIAQTTLNGSNSATQIKSSESVSLEQPMSSADTPQGNLSSNLLTKDIKLETSEGAEETKHMTPCEDIDATLIPEDFAPITLATPVDDAKYYGQGKFVYDPADKDNLDAYPQKKAYRPDYMPSGMSLSDKLKEAEAKSGKQTTTSQAEQSEDSKSDGYSDSGVSNESDTSEDSSEDDSDISSSTSMYESGTENNDDPVEQAREAQAAYARRVFGHSKVASKHHRVSHLPLDYDCPFPSSVTTTIQPQKMTFTAQDLESLDYLCQQSFWGGFPFAGDIENMIDPNGGLSNESFELIISRQRNLLQSIRGDTTHVPGLPADSSRATAEFKKILTDIFGAEDNRSAMDTFSPVVAPYSRFPSSTGNIKGPLTVAQYYELSETAQMHSKYYGKYQVKKRRQAEPNLDVLTPPDITIGREHECLEGPSTMIGFWEKLRLEPYSNPKNIRYFVLLPDNQVLKASLNEFFNNISVVYRTCLLGSHQPGYAGEYQHGLVPVPYQEKSWQHQYMEICRGLGSSLARLASSTKDSVHTVIYLMNPSTRLSSNLELSRCYRELIKTYKAETSHQRTFSGSHRSIVMQLMPMEHALRTAAGGYTLPAMRDIAFSVYNRCHTTVERKASKRDKTSISRSIYAPSWVLAKPIPNTIEFSLKNPLAAYPTVAIDQHAMLHMSYSFSLDRRWLVITWIDHRGELMDFALLEIQTTNNRSPLGSLFKEAWSRTKAIAMRTKFPWQFVIVKMGLIFEGELQVWIDTINSDTCKVSIVSVDIESPLRIDSFPSDSTTTDPDYMSIEATLRAATTMPTSYASSSAKSDVSPITSISSTNASPSSEKIMVLMLNHRIPYTRRRVEAYHGNLTMESMSDLESWILPLASGYLIQQNTSPSMTSSTTAKQSHPLAVELHLVYNNTQRTSYTTLHDIIKQYHALSFVNRTPSSFLKDCTSLLPAHMVLTERLCRVLLTIGA